MEQELYQQRFDELEGTEIIHSTASFKKKQFLAKADASFLIAKQHLETHDTPERMYWLQWAITIGYYSMLYATKAALISKDYEVTSHKAAQIALGHLFVPNEMEIADLELLDQSHRIFENEYVTYLEDAKTFKLPSNLKHCLRGDIHGVRNIFISNFSATTEYLFKNAFIVFRESW